MAQGRSKAEGCGCGADRAAALQRHTLWAVLLINAAMFGVELAFGLRAGSTGLIADSLDMLADAGIYGLSLAAACRSPWPPGCCWMCCGAPCWAPNRSAP